MSDQRFDWSITVFLAALPKFYNCSHAAVQTEAGFRTSAGGACTRMLAKLVSGLHKPDDQTVLLPPAAAAFVAPLPARCASLCVHVDSAITDSNHIEFPSVSHCSNQHGWS